MRIIFTRRVAATLLVSLFAVLALAACGNDPVTPTAPAAVAEKAKAPAAAPTSTEVTEPTPTQVVIKVTPAPVPTETPVPIATEEPTVEAVTAVSEINADDLLALTKSMPAVVFPASISKGAEEIDADAATAAWYDFLGGTRMVAIGESVIQDFCSDRTGTWVWELGTPGFHGQKFSWELSSDPGGSWRSIIVTIKMHDQALYDLLNYAGGDGWRLGLNEPSETGPYQAYQSPDCD